MDKQEGLLTEEEKEVLLLLVKAYEQYTALPPLHAMHEAEFALYVQGAQRLIMSRPVARNMEEGRL